MLLQPPGLPVGLRVGCCEPTIPVEHIRIPLHPLSRTPPEGIAGGMHHMSNIRRSRARNEPFLDLRVGVNSARAGECTGATDVVKENFDQPAEADRAPTLGRMF